jgi:hypothetical protein
VLFDLKGKRRRVVQGVYLMLAILMGGGLVLFGIGGDVSGGLFDAFSDRSGSSNSLVEDRIEENEDKVEADPNTRQYTEEGLERLSEADVAWQGYLEAVKKPEPSLASLMMQAYGPNALNEPADAAEAAEIVATADPNAQAYLQLVQYAALAGQDRKADLAGEKAIELAPKAQRSTVKTLVEQAKQPPPASTTPQPSE